MAAVLVTGGTGFVGRTVLTSLIRRGHRVRALVRAGSERRLPRDAAVEAVVGDVASGAGLDEAARGVDAVVHLVGIIREHPGRDVTFERLHTGATERVLAAARAGGVPRFLHMSALGTRPEAQSAYHRTKWAAEEAVRASRMAWTIFRPSVIFGPGDGFVSLLARLVRWFPVIPVAGDGRNRFQPVAVSDVAEAFTRALARPVTAGQLYEVGGPRAYTFDELLDAVGRALGRHHVRKLHLPVALLAPVVSLLDGLPFFPLTADQLLMMREENTCDPAPFARALDITLTEFEAGIRSYLR